MMSRNKQGAMFTILSVIMLMLLTLMLLAKDSNIYLEKSVIVEDRIRSVDYFIQDMERDIQRGMYITTFRALLGIQQHISTTGNYIQDLDSTFEELILNGTINNTYMSVMNNTEMSKWFAKISYEAAKLSIVVDYDIINVSVEHTDPWDIRVTLFTRINISDSQKTAYWIREEPLNTTLSIIDFEDPIYTVNTGVFANTIRKTNVSDFVNGSDPAGLIEHVENMYYIETNSSPSYLMRLQGNLNASEFGIESLVNLRDLESLGLTPKNKTCVDYIYFSDNDPQAWLINNTFNWLRIDNESDHLAIYDVEDIIE